MSKKLEKYNRMHIWKPTYQWYCKVFITVFILLTILFFILNIILKPYMRNIDPELTPWLSKSSYSRGSYNNG